MLSNPAATMTVAKSSAVMMAVTMRPSDGSRPSRYGWLA
jgi:hypothetical protein